MLMFGLGFAAGTAAAVAAMYLYVAWDMAHNTD